MHPNSYSPYDRPMLRVCAAVVLAVIIAVFVLMVVFGIARAEDDDHNHSLYHAQYQQWYSNDGFNCCNNNDCGTLPDPRVRETGGHTEVLVEDPSGDQWCPVTTGHLVQKQVAKSPDWSVNHACIIGAFPGRTACERLKCFMGKVEL